MSQAKSPTTISDLPILLVCSHGTNQTLVVQKLVEKIEPHALDIIWTNQIGETIKIDDVRDTIYQLQYTPLKGGKRFWVMLAADKLTLPAQNALLKILEDVTPSTQIILSTTSPEKLLPTIHSRCQEKIIDASFLDSGEGETPRIPTQHRELLEQLPTMSATQIFSLSQTYKDRPIAKDLIANLILLTHQNLSSWKGDQERNADLAQKEQSVDLAKEVNHLNWLLQANLYLEQNVNVKQVLEHTFFKFSGIIPV